MVLFIVIVSMFFYELKLNYFTSFTTLIIGFFLFNIKIIGGGDIKLLSVLILLIPNSQLIDFFYIMSLVGFFLAIFALIKSFIIKKKQTIAYGIAINTSFLICFLSTISKI